MISLAEGFTMGFLGSSRVKVFRSLSGVYLKFRKSTVSRVLPSKEGVTTYLLVGRVWGHR